MYYIKTLKNELSSTNAYNLTPYSENDIVNEHTDFTDKNDIQTDSDHLKIPTMHWIPKLHKSPFKQRFIANSSTCSTTKLSKLLTSGLTAIKDHVIKINETVYERSGKNCFWSIKNSNEVIQKLQSLHFKASDISTYDFSTLYTSLPHDLIKQKLGSLVSKTFKTLGHNFLACSESKGFFTNASLKKYTMFTCGEFIESLCFLIDNIFVRFGNSIYQQVIGIPMGTNCAPLIADLFLYCYESEYMQALSVENDADVIEALNRTSRYLDDLLNIDNIYFENIYRDIYPHELQLNKANNSDKHASFLDLDLSITNNMISSKIYDKRDDFDFDIVNFPFLDGDVPRSTSYGVYISQLIRFSRACTHVKDFNERNRTLTNKLLKQGYRYHKLRKSFSKFYYRNTPLVDKYKCSLISLLNLGISQPEFYGDVVYKLRKLRFNRDFNIQLRKLIADFAAKGYEKKILRCSTCLVFGLDFVNHFDNLF